jgi:hypothetical protein
MKHKHIYIYVELSPLESISYSLDYELRTTKVAATNDGEIPERRMKRRLHSMFPKEPVPGKILIPMIFR